MGRAWRRGWRGRHGELEQRWGGGGGGGGGEQLLSGRWR